MPLRVFTIFSLISLSLVFYAPAQEKAATVNTSRKLFTVGKYDEAIAILKSADLTTAADFNFLAKCYWSNYQYDSAFAYYRTGLQHSGENREQRVTSLLGMIDYSLEGPNLQLASNLLNQVGQLAVDTIPTLAAAVAFRKAQLMTFVDEEEAVQYFEQALDAYDPLESERIDASAYYFDLLLELDFAKADSVIRLALSDVKKDFGANPVKMAQLYLLAGYGKSRQDDLDSALYYYQEKALTLIDSDDRHSFRFLKSEYHRLAGLTMLRHKRYDKVLSHHQDFIQLAAQIYPPNHHRLGESYLVLSRMYQKTGNYELAADYFDNGIRILGKNGDFLIRLKAIHEKGERLFYDGEYDKALQLFRVLGRLIPAGYRTTYDPVFSEMMLDTHLLLATILFQQAQYEEAKEELRMGYKMMDEMPALEGYALSFYNLEYRMMMRLADQPGANIVLSRAMDIIDEDQYAGQYANIEFAILRSNYLIDSGRYQTSIDLLQSVISQNKPGMGRPDEADVLQVNKLMVVCYDKLGQSYLQLSKQLSDKALMTAALEHLEQGIDLLSAINQHFKLDSDRIRDKRFIRRIYSRAIEVCFALYESDQLAEYVQKAFRFNQLSNINQLQSAYFRNININHSDVSDSLILKVSGLKERTAFLMTQIDQLKVSGMKTDVSANRLGRLQEQLTANKAKYQATMRVLERQHPAYYAMQYQKEPLTAQ
ncbi:MAG: hypothetical protein AAFO69_01005, partial [Bacteroidota bacterium]